MGGVTVKGACLMPECPVSVVPTQYFTKQGYILVQSDTSATLVKGDSVIHLVPDANAHRDNRKSYGYRSNSCHS